MSFKSPSTPKGIPMASPAPSHATSAASASRDSGVVVRIGEASTAREEGWPIHHTLYEVVSTWRGESHTVQRRFREFKVLHERLKVHLDGLPDGFPLWGNLLNRFDVGVVEARRVGLQHYLEDALALVREGASLSLIHI